MAPCVECASFYFRLTSASPNTHYDDNKISIARRRHREWNSIRNVFINERYTVEVNTKHYTAVKNEHDGAISNYGLFSFPSFFTPYVYCLWQIYPAK